MKLKDFIVGYEISYLPTKRHRNARTWHRTVLVDVEVTEPKTDEFPVAFIVHNHRSVYVGAKDYDDFKGLAEYKLFAEEIRMYDSKLYKAVRVSHGAAVSTLFESLDYIKKQFSDYYARDEKQPEDFTEASVTQGSNKESMVANLRQKVNDMYVVYDGKVWERCGEPHYTYNTFGMGNNHGGTGFFIQEYINLDCVNSTTFNALDREKAIEHTVLVALNRGDTDDVDRIKNTDMNIEVLIPEAVKIRSREEYDAEVAKKRAFEEKRIKVEFSIAELRSIVDGLERNYSFDLANKVQEIIESHERKENA